MSEVTAIEMMDELAGILRERGDGEQADYLQGACDALYGGDLEETEAGAYKAGFKAALKSPYKVL